MRKSPSQIRFSVDFNHDRGETRVRYRAGATVEKPSADLLKAADGKFEEIATPEPELPTNAE